MFCDGDLGRPFIAKYIQSNISASFVSSGIVHLILIIMQGCLCKKASAPLKLHNTFFVAQLAEFITI